ncbi:MAG TPA: hypothetical protein VJ960_05195, partial [Oceanipulchritudo sp.]|nr:hypothetical protein [Oceanipulchritudo sp.]
MTENTLKPTLSKAFKLFKLAPCFLLVGGPVSLLGETLFSNDFEGDTVGEQPSGDWTFSPGSNGETNGSVIVDGTTDPV